MPVAPCFFCAIGNADGVSSRLKLDRESAGGQTGSLPDHIFFGSPLSPWHFSVTVSFALAPVPLRAMKQPPPAAPSLSAIERPYCPKCLQWRMALVRITPAPPGRELRTFECSKCDRTHDVVVPTDPLRSDAVRWVSGALRPPE
jgi:hypothetical protein